MERFASYEKSIESTVTTIKHTVRARLNSRAVDLVNSLKNVPSDAVLVMVVDDLDDGVGELVFVEEI